LKSPFRIGVSAGVIVGVLFIASLGYAATIGDAGAYFYNGCFSSFAGLRPADRKVQFAWSPPHWFCLYRTKAGRLVQRSS
jgi:hypothetical protein